MKVYFSHPVETFATPGTLEILGALREEYPGGTIVDPEDYDIPKKRSCEQCRVEIMGEYNFPLIEECGVFAIWAPIATCRIECELHHAWHEGKTCIWVSSQFGEVDFEDLTLEDYHKVESQTPTEAIL